MQVSTTHDAVATWKSLQPVACKPTDEVIYSMDCKHHGKSDDNDRYLLFITGREKSPFGSAGQTRTVEKDDLKKVKSTFQKGIRWSKISGRAAKLMTFKSS